MFAPMYFCVFLELMLLGFVSLLLTVSQRRIAKICIPKSVGETFLPCTETSSDAEEETICAEQVMKQYMQSTVNHRAINLCFFLF